MSFISQSEFKQGSQNIRMKCQLQHPSLLQIFEDDWEVKYMMAGEITFFVV